jgi:hypothetical protein
MEDLEFELRPSKQKLFEKCGLTKKLYRVDRETKQVFLLLRWDLLVNFGTKAQLVAWDKFRVKYINTLIERHCTPLLNCKTQIIGSKSPKSDIDMNMTCPQHIEDVLVAIKEDHHSKYKRSMEEMFDFNVYASVFHYLKDRCNVDRVASCYPRYELGMRQRMWSFLRIVQFVTTLTPAQRRALLAGWPEVHRKLYIDTKKMYERLKLRKLPTYGRAIRKFFDELNKLPEDPRAIAEAFSASKYLEHETYRSVGAVLHIVERHASMPKSGYYDSIYDNLGFIFEIMLAPSLCVEDPSVFKTKVVKTAKYIERIIDALGHVQTVSPDLSEINAIASNINKDRKALVPVQEMPVAELLALMKVQTQDAANPAVVYVSALSSMLFGQLKDATLTNFSGLNK